MTVVLEYKVARASNHPVAVNVDFNGEVTQATVQELEVELVSTGKHGTLTLHFNTPSEVQQAKDTFVADKLVTVTIY